MISVEYKPSDESHLPIRLLPHQKDLLKKIDDEKYPIYICWGMGSGKTIGACMCMNNLSENTKVLIICDKSTVIQWKNEVEKVLQRNIKKKIHVNIMHYEYLDRDNTPEPRNYNLTIVDEAHRFRNAWSRESTRMLNWIYMIQECRRVIYLSGTPIVHDPVTERHAFDKLMINNKLQGRVFFYDPRMDPKSEKKYPNADEVNVKCEMSWGQCFIYLSNRRQEFSIHLEDEEEPRIRMSSSKNTYNTLLRAISNNPFPEKPELSPKFEEIIKQMEFHDSNQCKQIIYSSRKDTGVKALQKLWNNVCDNESFQITGDMSQEERAENIRKFNRKPNSVLFITDAGGQGIDLKRVDIVHIMEPADNLQDERQIINRAIRYKSHNNPDSTVTVIRYLSIFPIKGSVSKPWKRLLYESGLFSKEEMKGITRKVQYALKKIINIEENNETIDQKIFRIRDEREISIQKAITDLKKESEISS